jgi:hypothetical protein
VSTGDSLISGFSGVHDFRKILFPALGFMAAFFNKVDRRFAQLGRPMFDHRDLFSRPAGKGLISSPHRDSAHKRTADHEAGSDPNSEFGVAHNRRSCNSPANRPARPGN